MAFCPTGFPSLTRQSGLAKSDAVLMATMHLAPRFKKLILSFQNLMVSPIGVETYPLWGCACVYIYIYVYIYIFIYRARSQEPHSLPPHMVWLPPSPPNLAFASYLQHFGGAPSNLYSIYRIWEAQPPICTSLAAWEPQPRHWTLCTGIFLTYQSCTCYPRPVYVLPVAYLTHGLPLIVCLCATCLPSIDYILKAHLCIPI